MGEHKRKRARNATPDEIFPGKHGPVQSDADVMMREILTAIVMAWPEHHVTVFIAEQDAVGRLPRFNYGSTSSRADMVAVLRAFIAKQDEMAAVDAAMDEPAKGRG